MSARSDKIVCPECGNDGTHGDIRYVESIECYRKVLGVKGGLVQVESRYRSGEGYDDGQDPYFECHGSEVAGGWCGHRWPVPQTVAETIDWVDDAAAPPPPAQTEAETAVRSLEALTCSKCGVGVASGLIRYVVRVDADRDVLGAQDGKLRVSSLYDTDADDGGGEDPHFACHNRLGEARWCDGRWPVPEWVMPLIVWA
jgi:hypothetical protein